MKDQLTQAIQLRNENKCEEALVILKKLLESHPLDPDINYQTAWTCDRLGNESEAAPFYETALSNGLTTDRHGAYLGLGSTYRCLGEYKKSLQTLDQAIVEFPDDRSLKVFRALTNYNLGSFEASVQELLVQLIETTDDSSIQMYKRALHFYSDKLNQTWK